MSAHTLTLAKVLRVGIVAAVVYGASYGALRAAHVMTRTGYFFNAYTVGKVHASEAGWQNLQVEASGFMFSRPAPARALELFYAPLIVLECQHFYTFFVEPGRRPLPACCVRNRNFGFAALLAYGLVAFGSAHFLWRRAARLEWRAADRCSQCGYDLQGLPAKACCPECGERVTAGRD
jgi:hypothetical protein